MTKRTTVRWVLPWRLSEHEWMSRNITITPPPNTVEFERTNEGIVFETVADDPDDDETE